MTLLLKPDSDAGRSQPETSERRANAQLTMVTSLGLLSAVLVSFGFYITGAENWGFALVGSILTLIVWVPLLQRRVPPLSVWGAVVLVVTIGSGIRGFVLATTNDDELRRFFILDRSFADISDSAIWLIAAVAALTIGHWASFSRASLDRKDPGFGPWILKSHRLDSRLGDVAIALMALLGLVGSVLYIRAVGGFDTISISDRRTTISNLNVGSDTSFRSYGHWEALAGLSFVAFALELARRAFRPGRWTGKFRLALLGGNILLLPLFTTTRGDLISIALASATIVWFSPRRIPRIAAALLLVSLLAFGTMLTAIRSNKANESAQLDPAQAILSASESIALNRNMFDLGKGLLVINGSHDTLERANGSTILSFVAAPIPRQIWPTKPLISPGPIVGNLVYGNRVSGVPPGFAGELVWNFGRPAAVLLAFALGALLGRLDAYSIRAARHGPGGAVFLAIVGLQFGRDAVGVSIGFALFSLVFTSAVLVGLSSAMSFATPRQGATR